MSGKGYNHGARGEIMNELVTALEGNHAVAYAVKQAKPQVLAVYPITPQTTMLEKLAEFAESGELKAKLIKVESEHSAMAAIYGAAIAGARVFTATASQGLLYMTEMIYWAGGQRVPIVAGIATRAVGEPWSIWDDHQDFVSKRDSIWIQMFAENVQDAYDLTLQAFRISEHEKVMMPVMMGFDGFVLTHTMERIALLSDNTVDSFMPERKFNLIDFKNPVGIGPIATQNEYIKYRYRANIAMNNAKDVIKDVAKDYTGISGREQFGLIEPYMCDDAEYLIITMGAWSGDARVAVQALRKKGIKIGLIKLRVFRPFPKEDINSIIKNAKGVLVMDRAYSFGSAGVLTTDIKANAYGLNVPIYSAIAGIGGKEVGPLDISDLAEKMVEGKFNNNNEVWLV